MTRWTTRIALAVLALAPAAYADETTGAKSGGKAGAVTLNAKEMKWTDAPPDLPKGAQMSVLHGDPTKDGPFALRLKMPDGYKVPPHWHTREEQLTVVSGELMLHMGDTMTSDPHDLEAGAYHFLPGKMHHGAEAHGETVVQIQGPGPFDIHYLNAADNPNPKSATR